MRDDRAVSEVMGFVIVFGIIITSVGILSVVGFQSMEDYQQAEQMQNAERAFDALSENFNEIQRNDGLQTRASEINLREGTIRVQDETSLDISVQDNSGSNIWSKNTDLRALTYERDGTTIAYEGGGVFRNDSTGNIDVTGPALKCTDDTAVVSLVKIEGDPPTLMSSEAREIEASNEGTEVWTFTDPGLGDVTVTIDDSPSYENSWNRILDRQFDGGTCNGDGSLDRATIRITTIEISY